MGTHNIPRNVKGESRILMIFSVKALIYTAIGAGIGLIFYFIISMFNIKYLGFATILLFGLIGFVIGTFKVPETTAFKFTQKVGGENLDDVIKRAIKFKMNKNKIYMYGIEEETKDEQ